MLGLAVNPDIADASPLEGPAIPGASAAVVENGVKQRRPGNDDQDDVVRGSEPRSRAVIGVDARDGSGTALFEIVTSRTV